MEPKGILVYQHLHLLNLSPEACKVFLFIVLSVNNGQFKIELYPHDVKMNSSKFFQSIGELINANVISKKVDKEHTYWINLTMIVGEATVIKWSK